MKRLSPLVIASDQAMEAEPVWQYSRYRDFTGGENRQLLPEFLKPNQVLLALNCVMTGEGVLETRNGKSLVFTNPLGDGAITSVHRYAKENGSVYIVMQFGTSLYQYAYDGSTQFLSPTLLAGSLNAAKFRSVVWKDKIILTNGVDNVKTWDGTTFADLGGSPVKSKYIKIYGSRLWLCDVANPNILHFSGLEDPASWDALNIIKLRDGDGDVITGFSPQEGGMVIFKTRSTWVLYGTSLTDFRIPEQPLAPAVGCVAPDSLLDEGLFLGASNVYAFNLSSVSEISDTHRVVIDALSLADKQAAFAVYQPSKRRALIYIGASILCLDDRYKGITSWDNLNASCFAVLDAKDDDGSILAGDKTGGLVYKLDNSATDDGAAITTTIQHPYLDEGLKHKKQWSYYSPEVESLGTLNSSITMAYDVDYGNLDGQQLIEGLTDNGLVWDQDNWDEKDWGEIVRITNPFYLHHVVGNRISYRLTALDRIKYLGYVTKWRQEGDL